MAEMSHFSNLIVKKNWCDNRAALLNVFRGQYRLSMERAKLLGQLPGTTHLPPNPMIKTHIPLTKRHQEELKHTRLMATTVTK